MSDDRDRRQYKYPLSVTQGTMLGNGHLGLLVWGKGNELNITLGCSDLWDHRGGADWLPTQNFNAIRDALLKGDSERLKEIFKVRVPEGEPARPSLIPIGHLSIRLKAPCVLLHNEYDFEHGRILVCYGLAQQPELAGSGNCSNAMLELDMKEDCFRLSCRKIESWRLVTAYEQVPDMKVRGFSAPVHERTGKCEYFIQEMPSPRDSNYGVCAMERGNGELLCGFARNADKKTLLDIGGRASGAFSKGFWRDFWKRGQKVWFEDEELHRIYKECLFKFESMTFAEGVPAGLQGPWIGDDSLPPWSGDYHFNINVQMCYAPALRAGRAENLRRMLDMVWSWKDKLRDNARKFVGIDNGYMLPHAVDDTGRNMGGFWTGTLDHGCTAWVAQMMFDYADYTGDMDFLENVAFDFMQGAFNVYYAMMEEKDGRLSLPVSISPEYLGSRPDAWGANASFQLAACHRLARNLIKAAKMLGKKQNALWSEVETRLPQACLMQARRDWGEAEPMDLPGEFEIGLWEGKYLEASHRHHSHLAGIHPFNTIDPEATEWSSIVSNSVRRWCGKGMNGWTGWCIAWAISLQIRLGNPASARMLLDIWRRAFVNKGGNSTHDAVQKGMFEFCSRPDIIQLDATMGVLSAIQDMLLYENGGVIHLFAGADGECGFSDMPAPGGFMISASKSRNVLHGEVFLGAVLVRATRPGLLRLKVHCPDRMICMVRNSRIVREFNAGEVMEFQLRKDEKLALKIK